MVQNRSAAGAKRYFPRADYNWKRSIDLKGVYGVHGCWEIANPMRVEQRQLTGACGFYRLVQIDIVSSTEEVIYFSVSIVSKSS